MRRLIILFALLLLLIPSVFAVDNDDCSFFCKVTGFFRNFFKSTHSEDYDSQIEEVDSISGASGTFSKEPAKPAEPEVIPPSPPEVVEPVKQMEFVKDVNTDDNADQLQVRPLPVKTEEQAIKEQIEIVDDRMVQSTLEDADVGNPLCKISGGDSTIGNNKLRTEVNFDESLRFEEVFLSCDQYERFGLSGDKMYKQVVRNSLKLDFNCEWGRVTTPTIYIMSASDGKDINYCAHPVTVYPQKGDSGVCHSEETLTKMKTDCTTKGHKIFTIPDANGCETVYCGGEGFSLCAPDGLLEKVTLECEAKGELYTATRYTEQIVGQDWPCTQIRCSLCPSEENLNLEFSSCEDNGGQAEREMNFDTGCNYVYCIYDEFIVAE